MVQRCSQIQPAGSPLTPPPAPPPPSPVPSLPSITPSPTPSSPSVKNLYFISELWSSSAQLSADKAQEALERRHGYLDDEGGRKGGEGVETWRRGVRGGRGREGGGGFGGGWRRKGRQAGTQPPRGTSPSPRYLFFFLPPCCPSLVSPPLTASTGPSPHPPLPWRQGSISAGGSEQPRSLRLSEGLDASANVPTTQHNRAEATCRRSKKNI